MNIAEWLNEVPGRTIIITGGHDPSFDDWVNLPGSVQFIAHSRMLGRKVACKVEVRDSMFSDIEDVGDFVIGEFQTAVDRLIFSFKDRN